jgi:hypothetical protein
VAGVLGGGVRHKMLAHDFRVAFERPAAAVAACDLPVDKAVAFGRPQRQVLGLAFEIREG